MAFRRVFGGEGERVCPPLLFLICVDGGVTLYQTAKKYFWEILGKVNGCALGLIYYILTQRLRKNFNTKPKAVLQGRGFIYYTPLFREQNFFMKAKGRSDAVRIGILYIKRTWGKGCICPVALTWLPKNGKMAAKWLRQNRQCKSCGSIANLAMR